MTAARATSARTRSEIVGDCAGRAVVVALLLLTWSAAVVAGAPVPARAAERVVTITPSGVVPSRLEVAAGDSVRFVSQDPTFAYRAESTGGAWSFDSGPTELLDGDYAVPPPVVQPGTYTYRVAQDELFHGSVVVSGATDAPAPAGSPVEAPTPAGGGASAEGRPAPVAAAPTSPAAVVPTPRAGVAPRASDTAAPVARAVPGQLPGADTHRSLGLPVALAALLVLGTTSLLVRLVLTEAALSDPALSDRSGTLRRDGGRARRW